MDKITELLKLYGVENSDSLKRECMKLVEIQGLTPDDPFFSIVVGHHIQTHILNTAAPNAYKSAAEAVSKARAVEIEAYKAGIDKFSAEIKNKMVDEMVPEVAGKVADAATEQITKMNRNIGLERIMIFIAVSMFCLVAAIGIGFALGNIFNLTKFVSQVNTSIYSVNTIIQVAVNRIAAAIFFFGCFIGFLTMIFSFVAFSERRKTNVSNIDNRSFIVISSVFVILLVLPLLSGNNYFSDSAHIQIVTPQTSQGAMISAIRNNAKPELLRDILKGGVDINGIDSERNTPLMLAASKNTNPETISLLIESGAAVNSQNESGLTPLMLAVINNPNHEVSEVLIKSGADVNITDKSGSSALIYAANSGESSNLIPLLLHAGGEPNVINNEWISPILRAVLNDIEIESIKALIKGGAEINSRYGGSDANVTLLMAAAINGIKPETMSLLLQHGADINVQDKNGMTALMHWARRGNGEIVKLLIDAKADIKLKDKYGDIALDYAKDGLLSKDLKILKLLRLPSKK